MNGFQIGNKRLKVTALRRRTRKPCVHRPHRSSLVWGPPTCLPTCQVQLKREKNMRGNDRRGYPDQRQHFPPGGHLGQQGPYGHKYSMPPPAHMVTHMVPPPLMGPGGPQGPQPGPGAGQGDFVQLEAPHRVPGVPAAGPGTNVAMGMPGATGPAPAVPTGDVSDPQSAPLEEHLTVPHVAGAMGPGMSGVGEGVEGATLGIGNLSL